MPRIDNTPSSFLHKHTLLIISLIFLFFRLPFLTRLPIFNDEAIYLDWGNRMIQGTVSPFYTLYDGKQPGLIWIFGIFSKIIEDPLTAGRLVSVIVGLISLIGIYKVCRMILDKKAAVLTSFLYIVTPIFTFYDRQALLESGVSAIGIWLFYFLLKYIKGYSIKYAVILGILLSVGLYIKSSVLLFLIPMFLIFAYRFAKEERSRNKIIESGTVIFAVIAVVLFPLYSQNNSSLLLSGSSRYALTLKELFNFPFKLWLDNLLGFWDILFWYIFPTTFIFILLGVYKLVKQKPTSESYYLLVWLFVPLAITIFIAKSMQSRYLVSYLPLLLILIPYYILGYKDTLKKLILIFLSIIFPLAFSVFLIVDPNSFFESLAKVSKNARSDLYLYFVGYESGQGIEEVREFLENKAENEPIFVGVRLDSGNPESSIFAYYGPNKNSRIQAVYFDERVIELPSDSENFSLPKPLYFISRDTNLAGMDRYLIEEKKIYKKDNKHFIGIYSLKR